MTSFEVRQFQLENRWRVIHWQWCWCTGLVRSKVSFHIWNRASRSTSLERYRHESWHYEVGRPVHSSSDSACFLIESVQKHEPACIESGIFSTVNNMPTTPKFALICMIVTQAWWVRSPFNHNKALQMRAGTRNLLINPRPYENLEALYLALQVVCKKWAFLYEFNASRTPVFVITPTSYSSFSLAFL